MRPRVAGDSSLQSRDSLSSAGAVGALLQRGVLTQFFICGAVSSLTIKNKKLILINGLASKNHQIAVLCASFRRMSQHSKAPRIPLLLRHLLTAVRVDNGRCA
jgi:hypothetical protein